MSSRADPGLNLTTITTPSLILCNLPLSHCRTHGTAYDSFANTVSCCYSFSHRYLDKTSDYLFVWPSLFRSSMAHPTSVAHYSYMSSTAPTILPRLCYPRTVLCCWTGGTGINTCCLKKIRTHLDLLSIPQLGGGNVKTFRLDQRLQYKTFSWHLNGFPDGNNIGSTA